jgi:hypothetical protein
LTLTAALAFLFPAHASGQEAPELDPDQILDYGWLYSHTDDDIAFSDEGMGAHSTSFLSIPISLWMRRLPCCGNPITPEVEGRTFGVRLRITSVIGFAQFDSIAQFDVNSVNLGAVYPGIELLFKTGQLSMLRPYLDVGWGATSSTETNIVFGKLGLRTEFVFPVRTPSPVSRTQTSTTSRSRPRWMPGIPSDSPFEGRPRMSVSISSPPGILTRSRSLRPMAGRSR